MEQIRIAAGLRIGVEIVQKLKKNCENQTENFNLTRTKDQLMKRGDGYSFNGTFGERSYNAQLQGFRKV